MLASIPRSILGFLATLARILYPTLYEWLKSDVDVISTSMKGEASNIPNLRLGVRLEEGEGKGGDDTLRREMLPERLRAFAMEKLRVLF